MWFHRGETHQVEECSFSGQLPGIVHPNQHSPSKGATRRTALGLEGGSLDFRPLWAVPRRLQEGSRCLAIEAVDRKEIMRHWTGEETTIGQKLKPELVNKAWSKPQTRAQRTLFSCILPLSKDAVGREFSRTHPKWREATGRREMKKKRFSLSWCSSSPTLDSLSLVPTSTSSSSSFFSSSATSCLLPLQSAKV